MSNTTCRVWELNDLPNLLAYLKHFDPETILRFGPHPFTLETLIHLFHSAEYKGFLLIEHQSTYIVGYAIVKLGYFEHDRMRFNSYSFFPDHPYTAMYAPSLASEWRNKGWGKTLWQTALACLKQMGIRQVLLWGGVQENNLPALTYYQKMGFEQLGRFEMNGMWNMDMVKNV